MAGLFPGIPKTLLREHYRCHPQIIDFCNRKFYHNQLIILSEAQPAGSPCSFTGPSPETMRGTG
ncbi:hypothetical protein [Chryseobacterium sp. sg2396]|uniref:hypothetical protein n=1 Tax=Chryseobacterium sp. sg2396 TaxID=3276280 RepID=UPI00366B2645